MDNDLLKREFPVTQDRAYLNTGTTGLVPQSILSRVGCLLGEYYRRGPAAPEVRGRVRDQFDRARSQVADIMGAEVQEIAFLENTNEGMNAVVHGLGLQEGDEVVVTDVEHPVGRVPWEFLSRQLGIQVVVVPARDWRIGAEEVVAAFSPRTRVVSISHVSFTTSQVLPVGEICREARARGIFSLLDGAQGAGGINFSLRDLECDAYAFPGYKWLLGLEGSGALWVRRESWDQLGQYRVSLRGTETSDLDGYFEPRPGPRQFEGSTSSPFTYITLGESAAFLAEMGLDRVAEHSARLSDEFLSGLSSVPGGRPITPADQKAGMVTFVVDGKDPAGVANYLRESRQVIIRSVPRPSALRASFHLYNTEQDVERLLEGLKNLP